VVYCSQIVSRKGFRVALRASAAGPEASEALSPNNDACKAFALSRVKALLLLASNQSCYLGCLKAPVGG